MLLLAISATITSILFLVLVYISVGQRSLVNDRLKAVAAEVPRPAGESVLKDQPTGLAAFASLFTSLIRPIRNLVTSDDEEIEYQLSLAGFREPAQVEVFASTKILLPVIALLASSFSGANILYVAIIVTVGSFFLPDLVLTQLIARRKEKLRQGFPDALDLLVICMGAGLGIDQAVVRVGQEIMMTCPALSQELQMVSQEQRAGKRRLEAWRTMSERLDLDFVRQFVTMLMQTERFGTPIADALSQFADSLRMSRMQEAEEIAAKTGVKLLFPLVFFIFPGVFVVLLGPALLHILKTVSEMAN
jgi:tight adherence protein C